jgi:hypothetical protein
MTDGEKPASAVGGRLSALTSDMIRARGQAVAVLGSSWCAVRDETIPVTSIFICYHYGLLRFVCFIDLIFSNMSEEGTSSLTVSAAAEPDSLASSSRNNIADQQQRGILCNDPTGLCLAWQGGIDNDDAATAGVYTNLTRLASQLHNINDKNEDVAPLITLETESAAWLIKEFDGGHAVALRVPSRATSDTSGTTASEKSTQASNQAGASGGQ